MEGVDEPAAMACAAGGSARSRGRGRPRFLSPPRLLRPTPRSRRREASRSSPSRAAHGTRRTRRLTNPRPREFRGGGRPDLTRVADGVDSHAAAHDSVVRTARASVQQNWTVGYYEKKILFIY